LSAYQLRDAVTALLKAVTIRHYRIGNSKLFLSYEDLDLLESKQSLLPNTNQANHNILKINTEKSQQQLQDQHQPCSAFETPVKSRHPKPVSETKQITDDKEDPIIQPKLEQEYWWDVARVTSRDFEMEQMNLKSRTETFKIIFKLLAYLIFFLIVLTSGVFSKLSLLTMVNAYKYNNQPDIYIARWGLLLCTALCVPYTLSFFSCLQTVLFSSTDAKGSPKLLVTLWVLFVEIGQTLGVVLMVFKVNKML